MPAYRKFPSNKKHRISGYANPRNEYPYLTPDSLRKDLIAYWKLSDITDTMSRCPLTNNGTVSFAAGQIGNAAVFDGLGTNFLSNPAMSVPNSPLILNNLGKALNFTVSIWVKLTDNTVARSAIAIVNGYRIGYINTTNLFRFTIGGTNFDAINPVLGQWYHLCLTYDYATDDGRYYVDGVFQGTNIVIPTTLTDVLQIGARIGTQLWVGQIDEAIYWNRRLTDAEVLQVRNIGLAGKSIL